MACEGDLTPARRFDSADEGLWTITSYFNPAGYRRRLANYRAFRERLKVPLVAVEQAHGQGFELTEDDAEVLIRVRDGDVMWQKERLLNVALGGLPAGCRKVAWVDCDIVFAAVDWADRVSALLDRFMLVQAFGHVHHLSAQAALRDLDGEGEIVDAQPSAALAIAAGMKGVNQFGRPTLGGRGSTSNGAAWAARRELLDEVGFYDACILGGGDLAMVSAAHGRFDVATRSMSDAQADHYLGWARAYHELVGAETSFSDGVVFHLWHGAVEGRRYRRRHDVLKRFRFDPLDDIAHAAEGGWRWSSAKPELHAQVRDYFVARDEDG